MRGRTLEDVVRALPAALACLALAGAALAVDAAAGALPSVPIHVTPASGGPGTVFAVRFRAADTTGVHGTLRRLDVLSVARQRPTSDQGCSSTTQLNLPAAKEGSNVRARLDPRSLGKPWCVGSYDGQIRELETPVCARGEACPAYVLLLGTVGRFTFDVRALGSPSPSSDTTPPRFGGLQRAFACTPGPQQAGETTPFTLSWSAATDNVTPSSHIVYDIYLASRSGGEDFLTATWVSAPGVTTFKTPGLPSHGSFYFVVRARDAAGNEDRNTIELHGSDPCE